MHQYATLEDTVYFGFGANLTSGAAGDGASPLFDVRLAGGAAGDAPILSGTPTLLTHANYSDGCYEVAVAATAANGFAAGNTYLVFVTLTIDSVTPAACIGSFTLAAVPANLKTWLGTAPLALSSQQVQSVVPATQKVDVETIKTQAVATTGAGTITVPAAATLASTTNITGGTITTTTNLTNLPAAAALEATLTAMKGATYAEATDSLEALRNRGDAAWITATGFSTHSAADVWAVGTRALTDKLGFALSSTGLDLIAYNATGVAAIADGVLDRNMATGTDNGSTTVRTMRQALRAIRNKWSISGTTITFTKEDDSTSSWTAVLTGTPGADPITASDPAGP